MRDDLRPLAHVGLTFDAPLSPERAEALARSRSHRGAPGFAWLVLSPTRPYDGASSVSTGSFAATTLRPSDS